MSFSNLNDWLTALHIRDRCSLEHCEFTGHFINLDYGMGDKPTFGRGLVNTLTNRLGETHLGEPESSPRSSPVNYGLSSGKMWWSLKNPRWILGKPVDLGELSLRPVVLMLQKSLHPVVSVFCTNIHEKLKIGDIGSIISVRNLENGIKALIHL